MRRRRGVAYQAAEESVAGTDESLASGRLPVWSCLKAGWLFFFTHFRQIATRLWFAAIILAILEYLTRRADASPNLVEALAYIFLYLFAFANLYALALNGPLQRPVIAGFAIGPDELRFFLATLIYLAIAALLLGGAILVGRQLADYVSISGDIAKLTNPKSLDDIHWFSEIPLVQLMALGAPLVFAGLVLLWFSTRYVFVPLHVIAVRKLAIFDAMSLTKGNSWRLFWLMATLGLILLGVGWAIWSVIVGVEWLMIDVAKNAAQSGAHAPGAFPGHHSVMKPGASRPIPEWIAPVVLTFTNLMAVSVIVGTLSSAYKKTVQP